jgi:hypothetical protein
MNPIITTPSPKLKDLTGQQFGKWTVLSFAYYKLMGTKKHKPQLAHWLCRCECGAEKEIPQSNLTSGLSKGCYPCNVAARREEEATKDLTGQQFGEWLVLKLDRVEEVDYPSGFKRQRFWLCRCSCGLEREVRQNDLVSGKTSKCSGCSRKINLQRMQVKGQQE